VQHRKKLEPCKLPGQRVPLIRWAMNPDRRSTGERAPAIGSRTQYILQGKVTGLPRLKSHCLCCLPGEKMQEVPETKACSMICFSALVTCDYSILGGRTLHSEHICKVISPISQWLSERGVLTSCTWISAAALRLLWADLPNK
jgi:hypothetical protein